MAKNGATADQMRQLQAKYKGLKEQYEFAQKSYRRANNMFRDSLMSPQAHDEIYAKLQGAKAQYDAVVAELDDVKRGTRFEKVEMAAGQASQAKGALQEANVAYSERYIIATNDMEIETISLNTGNWQLLVLLCSTDIFRRVRISDLPFLKVLFQSTKGGRRLPCR